MAKDDAGNEIVNPEMCEHYHNKGQEDAAQGKHDSPMGAGMSLIAGQNLYQCSEAYRKGQENHRRQTTGK